MRLTIARLGHLGDGIAALPEMDADPAGSATNGTVLVPMALPGEVVVGEVMAGRMVMPKVEVASPDRVRAPCPQYRRCGGCTLQHARPAFVADWKEGVVRRALAAQGITAPLRATLTSPAQSRRRASLAGRRLRSGAVVVGLHARASDVVVPLDGCLLLHPAILLLVPALEALTGIGASRKGEVGFAVTLSAGRPDVAVSGARELDSGLRVMLAELAQGHGIGRISWNGEVVTVPDMPALRFGRARVVPPPGAFLQATAEGEAALLAGVQEAVGPARRIADLFAGCGTFALPLAEQAEVHAVEGSADMVQALERGWRAADGLRRVTAETRDLYRRPLLADELARFDAVVIDPPRAGAAAQTAEIAASIVPLVAAVSCNPATFARDAALLIGGGFVLDWVQVIDQFRWSPHVELVASFSRAKGR